MAFTLDASGLTPVYGDEEAVGSSSSDGRHNPIDVVRTMNTNSQTSDEDELINRSTPLMKRLRLDGSVPTILCEELMHSRRRAPLPSRFDASYQFWSSFMKTFTRGDLRLLARAVFCDLCNISDDEVARFSEYKLLEVGLELTTQMVFDVYRHAIDDDPCGMKGACRKAKALGELAANVRVMLRELIVFRRAGVKSLRKAAALGKLEYKVV